MDERAREDFVEKVIHMACEAGVRTEEFRSMLFEMNERPDCRDGRI